MRICLLAFNCFACNLCPKKQKIFYQRDISISLLINADINGQLIFDMLIGGMFFILQRPHILLWYICVYAYIHTAKRIF
jgi:hypothetical protein